MRGLSRLIALAGLIGMALSTPSQRLGCSQVVDTGRGQKLADEYRIKFFETSAKNNINVEQAFYSIARDIKQRLMEDPGASGPSSGNKIDTAGDGKKACPCQK
jgi:hypothetical protein